MQIHFTGRNLEITPALKATTEEKMLRIDRRAHNITSLNITFHVENITHIAEATLHADNAEFHAIAKADDMYKAIDLLVDKLLSQITKHKEKMTTHR